MSIICRMFGHAPLTTDGYHGDVGYAYYNQSQTDGMGVIHLYLWARCPRCKKEYRICNLHVTKKRLYPLDFDANRNL
jgi:hypothetical protein